MNTAELGKLLICFISVNFHPVSCTLSWYSRLLSLDPVYAVEFWGLHPRQWLLPKWKQKWLHYS